MKEIIALLSFPIWISLGSCMQITNNPNDPQVVVPDTTWKLAWSDEFNTNGAPSAKNWAFESGFVRNHELQWYQAQNAYCENGMLVIEGRKEQRANPTYRAGSTDWKTSRKTIDYTAASLSTSGLRSWKYGRFEMRSRIDTSPGMWPAFWTLGTTGEWPSNGEIDIMEYYRNRLLANVAWGTDKRWTAQWRSSAKKLDTFNDPDWSTKFHVWRMDWTEESIKLYVDDQLLNSVSLSETINKDGSGINPFQQPQYIILNLAIGGDNGGDPSATTFPSRFEVDYVRVYQR